MGPAGSSWQRLRFSRRRTTFSWDHEPHFPADDAARPKPNPRPAWRKCGRVNDMKCFGAWRRPHLSWIRWWLWLRGSGSLPPILRSSRRAFEIRSNIAGSKRSVHPSVPPLGRCHFRRKTLNRRFSSPVTLHSPLPKIVMGPRDQSVILQPWIQGHFRLNESITTAISNPKDTECTCEDGRTDRVPAIKRTNCFHYPFNARLFWYIRLIKYAHNNEV